jgi:hypothetical protein
MDTVALIYTILGVRESVNDENIVKITILRWNSIEIIDILFCTSQRTLPIAIVKTVVMMKTN